MPRATLDRLPSGPAAAAASAAPVCRQAFAPQADAGFDDWFHGELTSLADAVAEATGPVFRALVLGGGYGRGEGGVVRVGGLHRPYNDVDLFLFAEGPPARPRVAIDDLARQYHRRLSVDVDISRPYRPSEVSRWQPTLMWHELAAGHVVIKGPADIITARCPRAVGEAPPATEALRLLLNRGAGLLWAQRVATGVDAAPDADFVRRNAHKAAQACGDALLLAHRVYGSSFAGREEVLAAQSTAWHLPHRQVLLTRYAAARRFKMAPDSVTAAQPATGELAELAGLWGEALLAVEHRRTGRLFSDLEHYAAWRGTRERAGVIRQLAANLRGGRLAFRHPRLHLYRRLARLLEPGAADRTDWGAASAAFLDDWRRLH